MTSPHARPAASWTDPVVVAFAEVPARRRMTAPLRQSIDLRFVSPSENREIGIDPAIYRTGGSTQPSGHNTGRLLNVRV